MLVVHMMVVLVMRSTVNTQAIAWPMALRKNAARGFALRIRGTQIVTNLSTPCRWHCVFSRLGCWRLRRWWLGSWRWHRPCNFHLNVSAIPELLTKCAVRLTACIAPIGPRRHAEWAPCFRVPSHLFESVFVTLEVSISAEIVTIVEASIASRPIPLKRARLTMELLWDLVLHHVVLANAIGGHVVTPS